MAVAELELHFERYGALHVNPRVCEIKDDNTCVTVTVSSRSRGAI
jgi:hypothetical protein